MNKGTSKSMKKFYPLVFVHWMDSCSQDGWRDKETLSNDPVNCVSSGWLIEKNKDFITICPNLALAKHPVSEYGGTMNIPFAVVKKIIYLKNPVILKKETVLIKHKV